MNDKQQQWPCVDPESFAMGGGGGGGPTLDVFSSPEMKAHG